MSTMSYYFQGEWGKHKHRLGGETNTQVRGQRQTNIQGGWTGGGEGANPQMEGGMNTQMEEKCNGSIKSKFGDKHGSKWLSTINIHHHLRRFIRHKFLQQQFLIHPKLYTILVCFLIPGHHNMAVGGRSGWGEAIVSC